MTCWYNLKHFPLAGLNFTKPAVTTFLLSILILTIQNNVQANELLVSNSDKPTGEMINVGTHSMHIFCVGKGGPTVVLNAGLGGLSLEWIRVQNTLAKQTRVCAYDRSGYGWSETSPYPRTSTVITGELFRLLKLAHVPGPYILVGHSFGGYTAQLFASRYQNETAGMVLVDASHPEQVERFMAIGLNTVPVKPVTHVRYSHPRLPKNLPAEVRNITLKHLLEGSTMATVAEEYINFYTSAQQVAEQLDIPEIPIMVLTRGQSGWKNNPNRESYEGLWQQLQSELAHMSPTSAHLWANQSGHHVHLDQPVMTANAITMVLERARRDNRLEMKSVDLVRRDRKLNWKAFASVTWQLNHIRKRMFNWPVSHEEAYAIR